METKQEWLDDRVTWGQEQQQREKNLDDQEKDIRKGKSTRERDISPS